MGAYRCALGALFFGVAWKAKRAPGITDRAVWGWVVAAGVVFAADLYVWHRSVLYVGAGLGTLLGNTQVFYVSLIGILFLGEKPTWRFFTSVGIAFIGILLLISPEAPTNSPLYGRGILFGLATGGLYAMYVLIIRRIGERAKGADTLLLAGVSAVCSASLFLVSATEGAITIPSPIDWLWLLGLAFFSQFLGWYFIITQISRVPTSRTGLLLLGQPLLAVLLGAWLFSETMTPLQLFGALLTLVGIYWGGQRRA